MSVPTDNEKSLVIGQITGVYGVKGWVKIKSFTQPEENILRYLPWQIPVEDGTKVVDVDAHLLRPQGLVVHIKGVDDRDVAGQLSKKLLQAPLDELPLLDEGEYYWHQLMNLKVISVYEESSQVLGRVTNIMETGANDVLVVTGDSESLDRAERLIPYIPDQFIRRVDIDAGEMWVDWDPNF